MLRLVTNGLRYRARRFVGTVLAIVLGVAFLAGTLVLNDTLDANFTSLFRDANANTDVVVRGSTDVGELGEVFRQLIRTGADRLTVELLLAIFFL